MNAIVQGEGSGFPGGELGDASEFSFHLAVEGIARGRFKAGDVPVLGCRGVFPYGEIGKFGQVPGEGGGEIALCVAKNGVRLSVGVRYGVEEINFLDEAFRWSGIGVPVPYGFSCMGVHGGYALGGSEHGCVGFQYGRTVVSMVD